MLTNMYLIYKVKCLVTHVDVLISIVKIDGVPATSAFDVEKD